MFIISWLIKKLGVGALMSLLSGLFEKSKVKSTIMSPTALLVIGFVIVSVGFFFFYHHLSNVNKENAYKLEQLTQSLQAKEKELTTLRDKLLEQNKSITDLAVKNAALVGNIKEADKKNQALANTYRKTLSEISKDPTPSNCDESIKYLRDKSGAFKW